MATVTYNSIAILNARISRFSFENEFEGGAFNRTAKKCTLDGVGIIKEDGAFGSLSSIRDALNKPRQSLNLKWDDGNTYVLANGTSDAHNGPLPSVNINEIHGGNKGVYVVGFSFVFWDCGTTPIQRFECIQRHTIDERGYLKIHRSGVLTISPQATGTQPLKFVDVGATEQTPYVGPFTSDDAGPNPDFYRRLVAGFLPYGFQRTKQEYYVDASLRSLVFDVEDKQLEWNLPKPVYDGDASFEYERSLDNPLGTKIFKVSFEAAFKDKFQLLAACIDTAMTRINFTGTTPDIIQSFKITEPSIFKGNIVTFEVTAIGFPTNNEANDLGNNIDQNLRDMLFASPYLPDQPPGQVFPDVYGANLFEVAQGAISRTALLRYDPCTAGSGLASLMGSVDITVNIIGGTQSENSETKPEIPTKTPTSDGDQETRDSAARTLRWSSKQSITQKTGMTMLEVMGGDNQFSFQTSLPIVVVVQTVEAVTYGTNVSIPWPTLDEGAVVVDMDISMNDAPPDASGHRMCMIVAKRTLHVNAARSANTNVTSIGGESNIMARVYAPDSVSSGRTPFGAPVTYNLKQNIAGQSQKQTYFNTRND